MFSVFPGDLLLRQLRRCTFTQKMRKNILFRHFLKWRNCFLTLILIGSFCLSTCFSVFPQSDGILFFTKKVFFWLRKSFFVTAKVNYGPLLFPYLFISSTSALARVVIAVIQLFCLSTAICDAKNRDGTKDGRSLQKLQLSQNGKWWLC